jgi:hypothetical protein
MFEFLKSKTFHIIGSFIVGFGIVAVFRTQCKEKDCIIQKAPPVDEVTKSTYQIGKKCYQFKTESSACKDSGVIEPFQVASTVL